MVEACGAVRVITDDNLGDEYIPSTPSFALFSSIQSQPVEA
jgi:hypothetical protein